MAEIIFKTKGAREILLTAYYNSAAPFIQNKDDVGFNQTSNPFSDYCFAGTCGNWQNDKIKILSLPDKGKLFRVTNPGMPTPVFANVQVGDMITVRDMIDHKVLRFSGEGYTDNAFTGTYLTNFTFERFCGATGSNIIVTVKLNMIDVPVSIITKYRVLVSQTCTTTGNAPTNYDVFCTGSQEFKMSQIMNVQSGFVRMTVDGGTPELGISKQNGGALVLNEAMPVTQDLLASLAAAGNNSPAYYPYGGTSTPTQAQYTFEYSLNGFDGWISYIFYVGHA